jgi:S1-C subfamily serine protease/HSP20 family molecular chaperone IbpA
MNFFRILRISCIIPVTLLFFARAECAEKNNRQTPVVKVVNNTAGCVVNISTEKILLLRQNPYWGVYGNDLDTLFNQFYAFHGMAPALKLKSVGSGVIVNKSGLVATNAHVVNMASNVYVILNDGTQVKGEVVYENKKDDLAFIKIVPPKPLSEAVLGQTKDLMLGETVVAIGNPLGLENTVTSGIISGKNRKFYSAQGDLLMGDMLQVDAPINPGNSGGPLFNLDSQLIGINVAVVQYSQSIGFAIPVEKLKAAMEEYRLQPKQPAAAAPAPASAQSQQVLTPPAGLFQNNPVAGIFPFEANAEMQETASGYAIKFNIANIDKNKIKIEVNRSLIKLSGEYSSATQEKSQSGLFNSQSFGSFIRTVPLPADADPESVKTDIQGDTLIINLSRKK